MAMKVLIAFTLFASVACGLQDSKFLSFVKGRERRQAEYYGSSYYYGSSSYYYPSSSYYYGSSSYYYPSSSYYYGSSSYYYGSSSYYYYPSSSYYYGSSSYYGDPTYSNSLSDNKKGLIRGYVNDVENEAIEAQNSADETVKDIQDLLKVVQEMN